MTMTTIKYINFLSQIYTALEVNMLSSTPNTDTISSISGLQVQLSGGVYKYWKPTVNRARMLIWNTTRNNSAWVNYASNPGDPPFAKGLFMVSVPGDWAVGDTITNSYDGASSAWVKLKLLDLPTTAKAVLCRLDARDDTPGPSVMSRVANPITLSSFGTIYPISATLWVSQIISFPCDGQDILYTVDASAADTFDLRLMVSGYWLEANIIPPVTSRLVSPKGIRIP